MICFKKYQNGKWSFFERGRVILNFLQSSLKFEENQFDITSKTQSLLSFWACLFPIS